jgi:hypothetical protein
MINIHIGDLCIAIVGGCETDVNLSKALTISLVIRSYPSFITSMHGGGTKKCR